MSFTEGHGTLYASDDCARVPMPLKVRFRRSGAGKKMYAVTDVERADEALPKKIPVFHGVGVDGVYLPFPHKANQFTGMDALPTFVQRRD